MSLLTNEQRLILRKCGFNVINHDSVIIDRFFSECTTSKIFKRSQFCFLFGRDAEISGRVLYTNFSGFVTNLILHGVLAIPAPFTVAEYGLYEFMLLIDSFKSILPANVVALIEEQEKNYEDIVEDKMNLEHGIFVNEILLKSYSSVSELPIWEPQPICPNIDIAYPLGLCENNIAVDKDITAVELTATKEVYYSQDNSFICVNYSDIGDYFCETSVYNNKTGISNTYSIPVQKDDNNVGFSYVNHTISMYPQTIVKGLGCKHIVRVIIVEYNNGYKTVFDYGGFDYGKHMSILFCKYKDVYIINADTFHEDRKLKSIVPEIEWSLNGDDDKRELHIYSPIITDTHYLFPSIGIELERMTYKEYDKCYGSTLDNFKDLGFVDNGNDLVLSSVGCTIGKTPYNYVPPVDCFTGPIKYKFCYKDATITSTLDNILHEVYKILDIRYNVMYKYKHKGMCGYSSLSDLASFIYSRFNKDKGYFKKSRLMFKKRLDCVEENPGPNMIVYVLWFLLILYVVLNSMYLFLVTTTYSVWVLCLLGISCSLWVLSIINLCCDVRCCIFGE